MYHNSKMSMEILTINNIKVNIGRGSAIKIDDAIKNIFHCIRCLNVNWCTICKYACLLYYHNICNFELSLFIN